MLSHALSATIPLEYNTDRVHKLRPTLLCLETLSGESFHKDLLSCIVSQPFYLEASKMSEYLILSRSMCVEGSGPVTNPATRRGDGLGWKQRVFFSEPTLRKTT